MGAACAWPFNTSPQYLLFKLLLLCDPCTQVPEDPKKIGNKKIEKK